MKRKLVPLQESYKRIQEEVNSLQTQLSDVIDRALLTKVAAEQLEQGHTNFDVNFRTTNDHVVLDDTTYHEGSRKFKRLYEPNH